MSLTARCLIHSAPLPAAFLLPAKAFGDTLPAVVAVYPSGLVLPERDLRISIMFAAAPGASGVDAIRLRLANGAEVEGALLSDRLWSPDRRMLTLLFDPGRVKSGLLAHDAYGAPLSVGQSVVLFIESQRAHEWRVASGGCVRPNPANWRVNAPAAATLDPLHISLGGAIDYQSIAGIAVADEGGERLEGAAALSEGEASWSFAPSRPWRSGAYQIVVHPRLENPCGDEIGEGFEHPLGQGLGSNRIPSTLRFAVE